MGNGIEARLTSLGGAAAPDPHGSTVIAGLRLTPRLQAEWDQFFFELRADTAFTNAQRSPLGVNYFDYAPASLLTKESPLTLWEHQPTDDQDTLRANFGIRSLNVGYRFSPKLSLRLGPYRYETTESDRLCQANTFSPACRYAAFSFPMGKFGGELRYDLREKSGTLRQLLLSAGATTTGFGGEFLLLQGLGTFALEPEKKDSLQITLHAYAGWHSNPQSKSGDLIDPGTTEGRGALAQVEQGDLAGILSYQHREGHAIDEVGDPDDHTRDAVNLIFQYDPGNYLFRGSLSFLSRTDRTGVEFNPPTADSENHAELSAGYQLAPGVLWFVGYRGFTGREDSAHVFFSGFSTDYRVTLWRQK